MSKHIEKIVQVGRMLFSNVHKIAVAFLVLCICICLLMITAKFTGVSIHTPWFDVNPRMTK